MSTVEDNGEGQQPELFSQLVLTLDRRTFSLGLGGKTENYDEAICMCQMAIREFEGRIRAAQLRQTLTAPIVVGDLPLPRRGS